METTPPHLCGTLREGAQGVDDFSAKLKRIFPCAVHGLKRSPPARPLQSPAILYACLKHEAGLIGLTVWTKQGSCMDIQTHLSAGVACASVFLGRAKTARVRWKAVYGHLHGDPLYCSSFWTRLRSVRLCLWAWTAPLHVLQATSSSLVFRFLFSCWLWSVDDSWVKKTACSVLSAPSSANPEATQSLQQEAGERWWW